MEKDEIDWGLVKITGGVHKGRIGYYDDDDIKRAVVYFASAVFCQGYFLISHKHMKPVLTIDLLTRKQEINACLVMGRDGLIDDAERTLLLYELALIDSGLYERFINARANKGSKKKVFISHSSKDKGFVRRLASDISSDDHAPWLDEWSIKVGEAIPIKVSEGIASCDVMVVVLSKHAIESKWVENEWQAKYWDEVSKGQIMVLPLLLEDCDIPALLKIKKYADFTTDYEEGYENLLMALNAE